MPKIRKRQRDVRHLVLAGIYLVMTAFTAVILSNRELALMLWGMFSAAMIIYLCYIPKPEPKPEVRIVKGAAVQIYGGGPRPKWSEAPKYANWLAMDQDGMWMWYESEPTRASAGWKYEEGHAEVAYYDDSVWENTLEERPKDEAPENENNR